MKIKTDYHLMLTCCLPYGSESSWEKRGAGVGWWCLPCRAELKHTALLRAARRQRSLCPSEGAWICGIGWETVLRGTFEGIPEGPQKPGESRPGRYDVTQSAQCRGSTGTLPATPFHAWTPRSRTAPSKAQLADGL